MARKIAAGERTASDAVEEHIARIEEVNPALNAVVWKRYDEARAEAREVDRLRAAGQPLGPLAGVPVTIKECLDLAGSPSTFGVEARKSHRAAADDRCVARLRAAGAIVLGKTNVAQCLFFLESDNPLYGRTNHPTDSTRSPGGSSGGEAAIIAAGGAPLGLGTDIGGSIRVPPAFCGIVGVKPTAGRANDAGRGSIPIGQRAVVSQVGVIARSVEAVALGLEVATAADDAPPLGDFRRVDVSRLRVGFYDDDGVFPVSAAVRRAVGEAAEALRRRGAAVEPFKTPDLPEAFELFFRLLSADRCAGLKRVLAGGPRVRQIQQTIVSANAPAPLLYLLKAMLKLSGRKKSVQVIDYFGPYTADAYWRACERQLDYQKRWSAALDEQKLDVLVSPAAALPAVKHGATVELGLMGAYTCIYNLLGWPAGVVPVTQVRADEETGTPRGRDVLDRTALATEQGSAGLPIAVQLAARPWREDQMLAAMNALSPTGPSTTA